MIDILGKRYYFFLLSLLIIIPGLITLGVMAANGTLPLSIDFTGGSLFEVKFASASPRPEQIIDMYSQLGVEDVLVQTTSQNTYVIRSSELPDNLRATIAQELKDHFKSDVTVMRMENVGPTIGQEVTRRAAQAVAVAALIVVLFMTFAFRGVPHALHYGTCAIIAMAHDVAVVLSLTAIGSVFWGWSIDALFLTALLTVIGFSVQDKVVVFDRIRENTSIYRRLPYEKLVNHSIIQVLQRSINTQLMTVEFLLLSLALFGGLTMREFCVILLVGLFCGTYSSIFVAAPILVVWETREWRKWFRKNQPVAA